MGSRSFLVHDIGFLGKWQFEVVIYDTQAELAASHKEVPKNVAAHTCYEDGKIQLMFSLEDIAVSLVAHEATHACFFAYAHYGHRRKLDAIDHPESLAFRIGNLTGLIWHGYFEKELDGTR